MFCCLVVGVVIQFGFMGRFSSNPNNRGGIVGDADVLEWEADGAFERVATMVGSVPPGFRDDGGEGVDTPQLVVGDLHQDRE